LKHKSKAYHKCKISNLQSDNEENGDLLSIDSNKDKSEDESE